MIGWDLITAMIVITSLSVSAYLAGRNLGKRIPRSRLLAETLLFCLVFAWFYAGSLIWAQAIPLSGVVYWSNLMPILLAFAAGLALAAPGLNRWRRPLTIMVLGLIASAHLLLPIARPLLAPAIAGDGHWQDSVCLQSHEATCGAAAAATLLNLRGMPSSETEMIGLCLTSRHGTEPLGLYRGLKLASQRFNRDARIASRDPGQWIARRQLPNVALIQFNPVRGNRSIARLLDPRCEGHAVVVMDFRDGKWILGDPAVGEVHWTDEEFRRRFTGDAICLVAGGSREVVGGYAMAYRGRRIDR